MYKGWGKTLQSAKLHKWYKLDTVIKSLHKLQDVLIYTPGKISINYMNPEQISQKLFDENQRFPNDGIYVCESIGEWKTKWDILRLTYSIISFPNRIEREYTEIVTQGDAEVILLSRINDLLAFFEQGNDTIDRDTFERHYSLKWDDDHVDTTSTATATGAFSSINPDPTIRSTPHPSMTSHPRQGTSFNPNIHHSHDRNNHSSNITPDSSFIFSNKSNYQLPTTKTNNNINDIKSTLV